MPESSTSATHEKKLRGGAPLWHAPAMRITPRLESSIRADVAVVGAGVSGAFMAHALSKQYESVVIVDRRLPAHGSTMASTALLQFEIDTPLTELSEKMGWANASRAWRRSWRATQALVKIVGAEGIRCGLRRSDTLYLSGDRLGARALKTELAARHCAGLPGEYLDAGRLREAFEIDRMGAIFSPGAASADPVALTQGLLKRAVGRGARLYSPVEIKDIMATAHGVVLDTGKHFIEAKYAVFCTGYELLKGIPRKGMKITSS